MSARWLVFAILLWDLNAWKKSDLGQGRRRKKGNSDIELPCIKGDRVDAYILQLWLSPLMHDVDENGLGENGEGSSILPKCIPTSVFEKLHSIFIYKTLRCVKCWSFGTGVDFHCVQRAVSRLMVLFIKETDLTISKCPINYMYP